jgi:hypothetical protein
MRRAAAAGLVALLLACEGAYLTAPPDSTITLIANPNSIASHGGVSELTAIVTEPIGTDVPDGTVVLWSTTLGRVDRETRTTRGIARNRLVSDSRSGTAIVVASSGGGTIPVPGPSASPSTPASTLTPVPTTRPPGGGGGGGVNSASVEVVVGNVLVATVSLRAVPSRITNSSSTQVVATVLDAAGNPVPNVPVFFEVVDNADFDFFDFTGPIHTDNNGEAQAVLRTRRTTQGTITVRASAVGAGAFVTSDDLPIPVL